MARPRRQETKSTGRLLPRTNPRLAHRVDRVERQRQPTDRKDSVEEVRSELTRLLKVGYEVGMHQSPHLATFWKTLMT